MTETIPSRAPPRGRYDRTASASQRAHQQRGLIERAVRSLLTEMPISTLTVKAVTAHAGIGRNTFYGHFHDLESPVREVLDRAEQDLWRSFLDQTQDAATPVARLHAVCDAWISAVIECPVSAQLTLLHHRGKLADALRERIAETQHAGADAGVFPARVEPERISALTAALLDLADSALAAPGRHDALTTVASDLLLRGLR